jgi:hypothetical protein
MMKPIKSWGLVAGLAGLLMGLAANGAPAPDQWAQPAAALAEQIAGILGPGQARLTIRNVSTISMEEIPAIRRLLEQDLKARGVLASGAESANTIRVTLSENLRERLWVAEIVEGNETRVAMAHVEHETAVTSVTPDQIVLHYQRIFTSQSNYPILAAIETNSGLMVLYPEKIITYVLNSTGSREQNRFTMTERQARNRDPRGLLLSADRGRNFTAFIPGVQCTGTYSIPADPNVAYADGSSHCHDSDDPWPIADTGSLNDESKIKAFYNAGRDYFTGVVTPSVGVDLPPFYTAALLPRPDGAGLLINGIDGKVQLVENGALKTVAGTRDWGSDFAALRSGCGAGTQIIASGSGEAVTDSLRAYELPALEAVPASAPLAMDGTVTALLSVPDGKSVFAIVRKAAGQGQPDSYEVDRVSANCN